MSTDDRPTPPPSAPTPGVPASVASSLEPPAPAPPALISLLDEPGKYRRWLVAVVLLTVLLQAILVSTSPPIARDGVTFLTMAQELQTHPIHAMRAADQHPGFPALVIVGRLIVLAVVAVFDSLMWAVSHLFGRHGAFCQNTADLYGSVFSWIWGARLVAGVFGVLVVLAVWRLAVRTFDRRTAVFAALLIAILPVFRRNAADALSDSVHLFFYLAAASLAVEAIVRRQVKWFVLTGAAAGAAFWVRPEGMSVAIVTALFLPVWAWRKRKLRMRSVVEFGGYTLLAAAIVAAPYFLLAGKFSSKVTDKEYISDDTAPRATAPGNPGPAASDASSKSGAAAPGIAPGAPPVPKPLLVTAAAGVARLASAVGEGLCWALLAPLIAGFFVKDPRVDRPGVHLFVLMLVTFHAALLLWLFWAGGYIDKRHIMPLLALAMPRTAAGLVGLSEIASRTGAGLYLVRVAHAVAEWAASAFHRTLAAPGPDGRTAWVTAGLCAVFAVIALSQTVAPMHPMSRDVVNASLELIQYSRPGDLVLTNSSYVPFYSQLKGVMLLKEDAIKPYFSFTDACASCRFVVFEAEDDPYRTIWPEQLKDRYEVIPWQTVSRVGSRHVLGFRLLPAVPLAPPPPSKD